MSLSEDIMKVKLEELWPVMKEQIDAGGSVRFSPKGISMLPMLRQGIDSVVISAAPDRLKKYDLPLYRRPDGHFVLHRVVDVKNDSYVMCGDNQQIREYGVQPDWIRAIVTGFYRGDKYVGVDNPQYIRYYKKRVAHQHRRAVVSKGIRFAKRVVKKIIRYKA